MSSAETSSNYGKYTKKRLSFDNVDNNSPVNGHGNGKEYTVPDANGNGVSYIKSLLARINTNFYLKSNVSLEVNWSFDFSLNKKLINFIRYA